MEIKEKILLIEDEKNLTSFMTTILTFNEYEIIQTNTGSMGIHMAASHSPDLILLDLGLPDMDGITVLERVREWSNVPIIVVSARQNEQEKVKALDMGANDYVTKPFGSDELLARIRSAIRITRRTANTKSDSAFVNGGFMIDYEKRVVSVEGRNVQLTPTEYKIVVLLSQNAGKVLTHDYFLRLLWGPYANENQTLRVNVANIRRKIEKNPADPVYIVTEVGVGYRMMDFSDTTV